MAYFDKETYERKAAWAEKHQWEEAQDALDEGLLNEDQVGALMDIASIRHNIHSMDVRHIMCSEAPEYLEFYNSYDKIRKLIDDNDLPAFKSKIDFDALPCDNDYFDDINGDKDNYKDYSDWYEHSGELDRLDDAREQYNEEIEDYLKMIDEKYGTGFCPTKFARSVLI